MQRGPEKECARAHSAGVPLAPIRNAHVRIFPTDHMPHREGGGKGQGCTPSFFIRQTLTWNRWLGGLLSIFYTSCATVSWSSTRVWPSVAARSTNSWSSGSAASAESW
jgi:hypothetical protein